MPKTKTEIELKYMHHALAVLEESAAIVSRGIADDKEDANETIEYVRRLALTIFTVSDEELPRDVCANVINYHNPKLGYTGGSFTNAIIDAAMKADHNNFLRIAAAFPHVAEAIKLSRTDKGMKKLQTIVHTKKSK